MQIRAPLQFENRLRRCRGLALSLTLCHAQGEGEPRHPSDSASSEASRQKLERLRAETAQLLEQVQREVASLGAGLPPEKAHESKALRARRAKFIQGKAMLAEIQRQLDEDAASRTLFFPPTTADPDVQSYYDRLRERVEKEGTISFPKEGDRSLHGDALLVMVVLETGELKSVEVRRSTSDELAQHSAMLLRRLAPFDPFPAALSQKGKQIVIATRFTYLNE